MDATDIKELLMGQTVRPDTITLSGQHHLVPGFTTKKFEEDMVRADPCNPIHDRMGFYEMAFDDLLKHFEEMIQTGRGSVSFGYGDIDLMFEDTNLRIECSSESMSLKQASVHAARLSEIIQLGRRLFDIVYRLA